MNARRFEELVAAYGADLARWPAAERDDAVRLIEASAEARAALAAARRLDAALARPPVPVDPAALDRLRDGVARRVARLPAAEAPARTSWLGGLFGVPLRVGAFAAAALVGVWLGWTQPMLPGTDPLAALQIYPLADDVL